MKDLFFKTTCQQDDTLASKLLTHVPKSLQPSVNSLLLQRNPRDALVEERYMRKSTHHPLKCRVFCKIKLNFNVDIGIRNQTTKKMQGTNSEQRPPLYVVCL
jgi:hypothetical protein